MATPSITSAHQADSDAERLDGDQSLVDLSKMVYQSEDEIRASQLKVLWTNLIAQGKWTRSPKYRSISVLLLCWSKDCDDLNTDAEVKKLERTFKEKFNYHTTIAQLHSKHLRTTVQTQVNAAVATFVDLHDGPDTLLIVYYAGHSARSELYGLTLQAQTSGVEGVEVDPEKQQGDRIVWLKAEDILKEARGHVLEIFDCCYAGALIARGERGLLEYLAATDAEGYTAAPGKNSFTAALIYALESFIEEGAGGFTTVDLLHKIRSYEHFPTYQVPVLSDRRYVTNKAERIVLHPLRPDQDTSVEDTSVDRANGHIVTLHFDFDKKPSAVDLVTLAEKFNRMFEYHTLGVHRVRWGGMRSTMFVFAARKFTSLLRKQRRRRARTAALKIELPSHQAAKSEYDGSSDSDFSLASSAPTSVSLDGPERYFPMQIRPGIAEGKNKENSEMDTSVPHRPGISIRRDADKLGLNFPVQRRTSVHESKTEQTEPIQQELYQHNHSIGDERIEQSFNTQASRMSSAFMNLITRWTTKIRNVAAFFEICETSLDPSHRRIRWTCVCGAHLYDDFREIKSGSLARLQQYLNGKGVCEVPSGARTPHDEFRVSPSTTANSGYTFPSVDSNSTVALSGRHMDAEGMRYRRLLRPPIQEEVQKVAKIWVLPIYQYGRSSRKVKDLWVDQNMSDEDLFTMLKARYFEETSRVRRFFALRSIKKISCVKFFHAPRQPDIRNFKDDWPLEEHSPPWMYEDCPAEYIPHIGHEYLMHLWQNPSHTDPQTYRLRNPPLVSRISNYWRHLKRLTIQDNNSPSPTTVADTNNTQQDVETASRTHSSDASNQPASTSSPETERGSSPTQADCRCSYAFGRTPKKLGDQLLPDDRKPPEAWGLYFEEGFRVHNLCIFVLFIYILASISFVIYWCVKNGKVGSQSDSGPLGVVSWSVTLISLIMTVWFKGAD